MARVSACKYQETVWSEVFPGSRHTVHCLQPAVLAAESIFQWTPRQRRRVVWRLDAGSGSDEQVGWLLERGYHLLGKGMNNHRAAALGKRVERWEPYQDAWIGSVASPVDFGRPLHFVVKKRIKKGEILYNYYLTTLPFPSKTAFLVSYDSRGGAEVEQFRNDKSGLSLEARRKHSLSGQKGYILLTDMAHNLLSDFYQRGLVGTCFEGYAAKRMVRDLLAFPGRLYFEDRKLVRVELLSQKHFAQELVICLERYCSGV